MFIESKWNHIFFGMILSKNGFYTDDALIQAVKELK